MDDEQEKGYKWETEYERTWEAIQENDAGSLQTSVNDIIHRAKKRRLQEAQSNAKLGMMRHLYIIIDMSEAMSIPDLKPTRLASSLKLLEYFVEEYFDQNPISQLGILVTRNKRCDKLTELGGNPKKHIAKLQEQAKQECKGEASLQNCLKVAAQTLQHMPSHTSREVLIIYGALSTCDPSGIHATIKHIKELNIRCSVIGLSAELRICKTICQETNGQYNVILDESHFKDLLHQFVTPPPATVKTDSSLIRMGFPSHQGSGSEGGVTKPSMCMCHLDSKSKEGFSVEGYFCPNCKSKYCELPVECKACGLILVSAPHIARSYHHLFPLDAYTEIPIQQLPPEQRICSACCVAIKDQTIQQCQSCKHLYCTDCDILIHETLHTCPGCAGTTSSTTTRPTNGHDASVS
ncbi:unnamed protein product [Owenia fusiformis]|uniref:General transcription factor IIH subunit n=1 Tax=Owenia fusiformis TaxID=6347 RepID=A0A8S4N2C1_OWEFU|nr:unnamed protein product [Owenia fusiformis]